jgi:predicted ATPase
VAQRLGQLVDEIAVVHSKLVLLIGAPNSGKSSILRALGAARGASPLNVGSELARRLAAIPQKERPLQTISILRELADQHAKGDLLLLDNLELLFDRALQLDPLDLLKRHAHARRVVAVWPGEMRDGRLTYAEMGHPEHQDYGIDGLVPFSVQ